VPTGVWVDETGKIVRGAKSPTASKQQVLGQAIGDDRYAAWTRDWGFERASRANTRFPAEQLRSRIQFRSENERRARPHFKLGAYFSNATTSGEPGAKHWQKIAGNLNPDSWNYHRQDWSYDKKKEMANWMAKVRKLGTKTVLRSGRSFRRPRVPKPRRRPSPENGPRPVLKQPAGALAGRWLCSGFKSAYNGGQIQPVTMTHRLADRDVVWPGKFKSIFNRIISKGDWPCKSCDSLCRVSFASRSLRPVACSRKVPGLHRRATKIEAGADAHKRAQTALIKASPATRSNLARASSSLPPRCRWT